MGQGFSLPTIVHWGLRSTPSYCTPTHPKQARGDRDLAPLSPRPKARKTGAKEKRNGPSLPFGAAVTFFSIWPPEGTLETG